MNGCFQQTACILGIPVYCGQTVACLILMIEPLQMFFLLLFFYIVYNWYTHLYSSTIFSLVYVLINVVINDLDQCNKYDISYISVLSSAQSDKGNVLLGIMNKKQSSKFKSFHKWKNWKWGNLGRQNCKHYWFCFNLFLIFWGSSNWISLRMFWLSITPLMNSPSVILSAERKE